MKLRVKLLLLRILAVWSGYLRIGPATMIAPLSTLCVLAGKLLEQTDKVTDIKLRWTSNPYLKTSYNLLRFVYSARLEAGGIKWFL